MWTVSIKPARTKLNESDGRPPRTAYLRTSGHHERKHHVTFLNLYIDLIVRSCENVDQHIFTQTTTQQFALFHYNGLIFTFRNYILKYRKRNDVYILLNMAHTDIRTDCNRLFGSIECISSVKCPSHKLSGNRSSAWVT